MVAHWVVMRLVGTEMEELVLFCCRLKAAVDVVCPHHAMSFVVFIVAQWVSLCLFQIQGGQQRNVRLNNQALLHSPESPLSLPNNLPSWLLLTRSLYQHRGSVC